MLTLGIETSCDDTAVAVLADASNVLSSIVSSQDTIHAPYGGIVPELACRSHIEKLRPAIHLALEKAEVALSDIDLIATTQGPGLIGALLVGFSFAKALAYGLRKPLVPVHHLEGHINSIHLEHPALPYPLLTLVVSGGHTDLYYSPQRGQYKTLGRTRDDAAGECFDKVAKMMHLGYPGGPVIDRLAREGNPQSIAFPRAMLTKKTYDFSFSGIKTAIRSHLLSITGSCGEQLFQDDTFWPLPQSSDWPQQRNDILASFQQAVVDVLVAKTLRAVKETHAQAIAVVGGVACNSALRHHMHLAGKDEGLPVFFPSPRFCTDNAAMIACAAYHRYLKTPQDYDHQGFLDLEARANLAMPALSV